MYSKCYRYNDVFLLVIVILSVCSCDHGLKPAEEKPSQAAGISGTISYINWPPTDSLFDLRLVIFEKYPPDNIRAELEAGRAHVFPGLLEEHLPFNVDTTTYVMELAPGYYEYVAVAQRYGLNILEDWLAAGQYDTLFTDELPTPITVLSGEILEDIKRQTSNVKRQTSNVKRQKWGWVSVPTLVENDLVII